MLCRRKCQHILLSLHLTLWRVAFVSFRYHSLPSAGASSCAHFHPNRCSSASLCSAYPTERQFAGVLGRLWSWSPNMRKSLVFHSRIVRRWRLPDRHPLFGLNTWVLSVHTELNLLRRSPGIGGCDR